VSGNGWTDARGDLWLFGGYFHDPVTGSDEFYNDVWKYSGGEWTWMAGPNVANKPGVYGTLGVASPANVPGARVGSVNWTDKSGNFWLFGGFGFDPAGNLGDFNDLWKYSAGQWTWMSGSNLINQPGVYGTQGTASPSNVPRARSESAGWTDAAGDLWLFGGGIGSLTSGYLNDLWRYSAGQWTWMGGSNVLDQSGVYGTQGVAASSTTPGAREPGAVWTDASGNFWLFGGWGHDSAGTVDGLDDLWRYSAGQWTWIGGSTLVRELVVFGTQGTPAPNNTPGARSPAAVWTDTSGDVWFFGGPIFQTSNTPGFQYVNDLWKYQP
jgi:N-acetylneuraminic acid mutarotase